MLQSLQKYQHIFIAMLMVFVLAPWFTPASNSAEFLQLDFWAVWLVAMFFIALPMNFLEIALAKRSKKLPMLGMEELTRQADVKTSWRSVSWLALGLLLLICGGLIAFNASTTLAQLMPLHADAMSSGYLWIALITLAVISISFVGLKLLPIAALLAFAAVVASGVNISSQWQITSLSGSEWKNAVLLAITATGLGTGLYWQSSLTKQAQQQQTMLRVLPMWVAQVVAGLLFVFFQGISGETSKIIYAIASVVAGAVLLAFVRDNIQAHSNNLIKAIALPVVFVAISAVLWHLVANAMQHPHFMTGLVALTSIAAAGIYAVFAGWHMKISHLRKSINFGSEMSYNLWRVAVRLLVPLVLASALVFVFIGFAR